MTSRSTITPVGVPSALALTATLLSVSTASAEPGIRGNEPYTTDRLLMSLCNGRTGTQDRLINV